VAAQALKGRPQRPTPAASQEVNVFTKAHLQATAGVAGMQLREKSRHDFDLRAESATSHEVYVSTKANLQHTVEFAGACKKGLSIVLTPGKHNAAAWQQGSTAG
jgi:hypothetical protein